MLKEWTTIDGPTKHCIRTKQKETEGEEDREKAGWITSKKGIVLYLTIAAIQAESENYDEAYSFTDLSRRVCKI